ncbi:enoyl-CoA hydratase/isomerase family protein [Jiangella ureilytica]|uniref:Enoyl-CoA hydratase/isomerase family protein n=1 Tax=Jiangella ureilytica TaxID=2530374 RepID=A0A4R4RRY5_9ACTN|nr:enoyl-CoA hydratase/isomerase family protein [Jiangella ureilytica]TDC52758.1 enoyl-CoA hydratase/isomerase family protein [Jiangella ureilytica]
MTARADLTHELAGTALRITLDRPDHRNAFSGDMMHALVRCLREAEERECAVVSIEAVGEDFCTGRDHNESPKVSTRWTHEQWRAMTKDVFGAFGAFGGATVAAVKGRAAGFGALLATCCDVTIAADDARLAFDEVVLGFAPRGVMSRLFNRLGERRLTELVLTGRSVPGNEAWVLGLVTEHVAPELLAGRLDETVATLTRHDRTILRAAKSYLAELATMNPADRVRLGTSDRLHPVDGANV